MVNSGLLGSSVINTVTNWDSSSYDFYINPNYASYTCLTTNFTFWDSINCDDFSSSAITSCTNGVFFVDGVDGNGHSADAYFKFYYDRKKPHTVFTIPTAIHMDATNHHGSTASFFMRITDGTNYVTLVSWSYNTVSSGLDLSYDSSSLVFTVTREGTLLTFGKTGTFAPVGFGSYAIVTNGATQDISAWGSNIYLYIWDFGSNQDSHYDAECRSSITISNPYVVTRDLKYTQDGVSLG